MREVFSSVEKQLRQLDEVVDQSEDIQSFKDKMRVWKQYPLKPTQIDVFQVNLGKMCNQRCRHCHVDAGPHRKEIMTRDTMQQCIEILEKHDIPTVDLTGGAPEMNPDFRWFVEECTRLNKKVIVRCNLTIILAEEQYRDLPGFYKKHNVEVVSSLPFYYKDRTDKQRGLGVFEQSMEALKILNNTGYGIEGSGLILNLVYNPAGAFLPAAQHILEDEFKKVLKKDYGITFNGLFSITNMPVGRYLDYLVRTENYVEYMEKLVNVFNPMAAEGVMCRNSLSISWDGYIYDCDFNQMLEMPVAREDKTHITNFDFEYLRKREIVVSQHCYGCTAGAGSSCSGNIV